MLLRSFAVQGSWNYETLIGAGFAFTLMPALRYLYRQRDEQYEQAVERHTELFNSHPYLATVAVGAVSRLEAEGTEPLVVQRFKTALRGSLGSMGDRLVWSIWRPMSVLLGLVLLLGGAPWWAAVATFLIVYNTLHLVVRIQGLRIGTEAGLEVGRLLREAPVQSVIEIGSRVSCFLVGLAIVLWSARFDAEPVTLLIIGGAAVLGFVLGLQTRRVMAILVGIVVAVALLIGLFGNGA